MPDYTKLHAATAEFFAGLMEAGHGLEDITAACLATSTAIAPNAPSNMTPGTQDATGAGDADGQASTTALNTGASTENSETSTQGEHNA